MQAIDIYAGSEARQVIQQHGFRADLFDFMLGASGGPKWFVLAGLDQYLLKEFFAGRRQPLDLVGSSAGAFRFACYGQQQPLEALDRLIENYSHITYSKDADRQEITAKSEQLVKQVLGEQGARQIVENPVFRSHFVTARCLGWAASERRGKQLGGLLTSAVLNKASRRLLKHFYQRVVFNGGHSTLRFDDGHQFDTLNCGLRTDNVEPALLASGAIPLIIQGVKNVPGAPPGMYRDGGLIDYHFDLSVTRQDGSGGLCLYPHFSQAVRPGWFDKTSQRNVQAKHYKKVVMVVPSRAFLASLPYGKIPDRKDFEHFTDRERIDYWQQVIGRSEQLAESFSRLIASPDSYQRLLPIEQLIQR